MARIQEEPEFEQRDDAVWVYAGTRIPVPGAQTLTLGEVVTPRELRRVDEPPETAVFSLSEIIAEPKLNWILREGTRLRGGDEDLFAIPWDTWLDYAGREGAIWAPERDGSGIVRRLATDERAVRFARQALEDALETRGRRVAFASLLGMSRRQVGELLGVSATRVQQLMEEIDRPVREQLEKLAADARVILDALPERTQMARRSILRPPEWDRERLERALDALVEHGLLEEDPSTGMVRADGWSAFRGRRLQAVPTAERRAHG